MLSNEDQKYIISQFPKNIKLSYENFNHNKVFTGDVYLAIPCGKKCFAWFTLHKEKEVCFILELNDTYQINYVKIYNCVFNPNLVLGTITFGTMFTFANSKFFTVDDMFYYKGIEISSLNWLTKWKYMELFFKDVKQISYNKHFIVFGLPFMSSNGLQDFIDNLKNVPYKVFRIQIRNLHTSNYSDSMPCKNLQPIQSIQPIQQIQPIQSIQPIQPIQSIQPIQPINMIIKNTFNKENHDKENNNKVISINYFFNIQKTIHKPIGNIIFEVRPDIQTEIYHLYCLQDDTQKLINYGIALIQNIQTSVKMNKLFRNIKENDNMDLMEESDSEDEFENNREDKYVYLERKYKMFCTFNKKFKKWVPMELADERLNISSLHEVKKYG